jgi:hypothetical protein
MTELPKYWWHTIFYVGLNVRLVSKGVSMLQVWELAHRQQESALVSWVLPCTAAK